MAASAAGISGEIKTYPQSLSDSKKGSLKNRRLTCGGPGNEEEQLVRLVPARRQDDAQMQLVPFERQDQGQMQLVPARPQHQAVVPRGADIYNEEPQPQIHDQGPRIHNQVPRVRFLGFIVERTVTLRQAQGLEHLQQPAIPNPPPANQMGLGQRIAIVALVATALFAVYHWTT